MAEFFMAFSAKDANAIQASGTVDPTEVFPGSQLVYLKRTPSLAMTAAVGRWRSSLEDEWYVLRVVMSGTVLCEAIMAHRLTNTRGHDGHYEWTGPLKLVDMSIEWIGPLNQADCRPNFGRSPRLRRACRLA